MSVQAISWAFKCRVQNPSEKLVLLALANYADTDGRCWPRVDVIARDTSLTSRTVKRALQSLSGVLVDVEQRRDEEGRQASNVYRLRLEIPECHGVTLDENQSDMASSQSDMVSPIYGIDPSMDPSRGIPRARGFDEFWQRYPKKRSKGQAEKAWQSLKPNEQQKADIFAGLERAKTSDDWARDGGKFIPHPATWLRAKGWEDEFEEAGNATRKPSAGERVRAHNAARGV